jgi:phage-related protein
MIYTKEYKLKFYKDLKTGQSPVFKYIDSLPLKERAKILKYIDFLQDNKGQLDEPYSKHIRSKIRELRVDFARNRYRIFYFIFIEKTIILLHAFLKQTDKTPEAEIRIAESNYREVIKNKEIYK